MPTAEGSNTRPEQENLKRDVRGHSVVLLEPEAALKDELAGGLVDPGKHGAHHYAGRPHGQGLDGTPSVLHAAVGNDRDTIRARHLLKRKKTRRCVQ